MSDNTINSDLIRGHIDTIILKSLYEGDRYGYDIIKEIEQKTDGEYKLKQPTLYSCLKRLEEQGFTSSYWGAKSMGGRKKYYTLTDMGKQLFIKNHTDWERSRSIIDKLVSEGFRYNNIESDKDRPDAFASHSISDKDFNVEKDAVSGKKTSDNFDLEKAKPVNSDGSKNYNNSTSEFNPFSNAAFSDSESTNNYINVDADANFSNDRLVVGPIEGLENLFDSEKDSRTSRGLFDGAPNTHYYQNFDDAPNVENANSVYNLNQKYYDNFDSPVGGIAGNTVSDNNDEILFDKKYSKIKQNQSEIRTDALYSSQELQNSQGLQNIEDACRELTESETDPNHLIRKVDFSKSTYELAPGSDILTEVTVTDTYGTESDAKHNTSAGNDTRSEYSRETKKPSQFRHIASDCDFTTNESYYLNQKDKPSYIDEVASAVYVQPAAKKNRYEETPYIYEDELPYEEHFKQQYGKDAENTNTDSNSSISNSSIISSADDFTDGLVKDSAAAISTKRAQTDNDATIELPSHTAGSGITSAGEEPDGSGYDVNELKSEFHENDEADDQNFSQFIKYDSSISNSLSDNEIVNRDYLPTLSKLIREQKPQEQKPQYSSDPYLQNKLVKTEEATTHLGDRMIIRKPNDSIKEYNSENFFYSNKLKLAHYFILFLAMLAETAIVFAFAELGIHKGVITSTDGQIYLAGVLVAVLLPFIAFVMAALSFHKRKKIDFDFKSSLSFRLILTALLCLIIALVNVYLKITTKPFTEYLARFIYPMVMAANIVISLFIYKPLLMSKKFNCQ